MARYLPMPKESERDLRGRLKKLVPAGVYNAKWRQVEEIYKGFVADLPDVGGKKNPMHKNLYGALACFAFFEAFERKLSDDEMRDVLRGNTVRGNGRSGLARVDLNKPSVQRIAYLLLNLGAKMINRHKKYGAWGNTWGVAVNPLGRKEGVSVHLVGCPIADFAKSHGYESVMPIFCESDYEAIRSNMGKALYREHTVAEGFDDCDYWIRNLEA